MIKFIKTYKVPLLLTLSLFLVHAVTKDYSSKYQKPISGDAQAYYAYLPALFIYDDLSYEFLDKTNKEYYTAANTKSFLNDVDGKKVNKTFPGVAILYAPFFLIAHGIALIGGLDADGYSFVYQFCFDIALWFYLLIGLIIMQSILIKFKISNVIAELTSVILVLGTNMFFYSFYDQSVTHIYNFFLINCLVLVCVKLTNYSDKRGYVLIGILLALIAITRPTNVLVFGVVLFFIPAFDWYKKLLNLKHVSLMLVGALPLIFIPFVLWKLQTGHWIVYSYGEEGFDFSNPEIVNFLFSFLKGWFVYTPIAALALTVGLSILFKSDRKRFYIGVLFYLFSIYIFSSWWCWYYGAGMGQRVMIDHYLILGFLIAIILKYIWNKGLFKVAFLSLSIVLIGFNIAQAYQIRYGIIPNGTPTKQAYFDNFLSFEKRARIYPYDHWLIEKEQGLSFEPNSESVFSGNTFYFEDEWSIRVTETEPFSANLIFPELDLRKGSHLVVSFQARARSIITDTRVVYKYNEDYGTFFLSPYLKENEWINIEFLIEPTQVVSKNIVFYLWNAGSKEKVELKDMHFTHYFSEGYY